MRQLAFRIVDILVTLLCPQGYGAAVELQMIAIFCGAGLDASLLCLANGWL